jgi:hypothetical protein
MKLIGFERIVVVVGTLFRLDKRIAFSSSVEGSDAFPLLWLL